MTPAYAREVFCCPVCRSALVLDGPGSVCAVCTRRFENVGGIPCFLVPEERQRVLTDLASDRENALKNWFKRWPRFYELIVHVLTPVLFTGLTSKKFLGRFPARAGLKILNVGSGPYRLHPDAVDLDLYPFPNVDVLGDATRLPFTDASFDVACSDQVLEHVADPFGMIAEMVRVTKPGGLIFIGVPFVYPLHPSPRDYTRWTHDGLIAACRSCAEVERGIMGGPTSGMLSILAMWLATVFSFGMSSLRKALHYVFMVALSPLKLIDLVYARLPGAECISFSICVVVRVTGGSSSNVQANDGVKRNASDKG